MKTIKAVLFGLLVALAFTACEEDYVTPEGEEAEIEETLSDRDSSGTK